MHVAKIPNRFVGFSPMVFLYFKQSGKGFLLQQNEKKPAAATTSKHRCNGSPCQCHLTRTISCLQTAKRKKKTNIAPQAFIFNAFEEQG
ncbi:MAG: hypothetical protein WC982_10065 [Advenella sp.]